MRFWEKDWAPGWRWTVAGTEILKWSLVNLACCWGPVALAVQEGPLASLHTGSLMQLPCIPPQEAKEKMEQLEGPCRGQKWDRTCPSRGLQKQHCQLEAESQALASKMAALVPEARHRAVSSQAIMEETPKIPPGTRLLVSPPPHGV